MAQLSDGVPHFYSSVHGFDVFGRFLSSFIRHDTHCEISCQNIYKGFGRLAIALQKKETRRFQSGLFFFRVPAKGRFFGPPSFRPPLDRPLQTPLPDSPSESQFFPSRRNIGFSLQPLNKTQLTS
jgi:hypothetical protein